MASFRQTKFGWRAEIFRHHFRKSKSGFRTKAAAIAWAASIEAGIIAGTRSEIPNKTFGDLLDRYATEVSVNKKGWRWEQVRITQVSRDAIAAVRLRDLDATCVAKWRDTRLKSVSAASVRREWNLLSAACSIAVQEWKWLTANPFAGVRRPAPPQHRDRLASPEELATLDAAATTGMYKSVMRAARFAIETGMRAGEIVGLTWERINGNVARLEDTKNGTRRDVPLSPEALRILGTAGTGSVFGLNSAQLDVHWRRLCRAAGVRGLHFHDFRRLALTRLSKKLNPLELAKMFGHKGLKMLMVYYGDSAQDIAKKL